jgi:3-methylfumaryl-CoA hydratase
MNEVVERTEQLVPGPAEGLSALLDVPLPDFAAGDGLPLLWHWLYLLGRPAQRDVGPDGHPARGTIPAPPEPGRRRMWAGGSVESLGVLRCGEEATRRTTILSTQTKQGRSGTLTFLAVGHQISQQGRLVVDERQDLVYRDAATPANSEASDPDTTVPASSDEWSVDVSPSLLFRFSALTYNGHRIHYDRDYARDVEGYPGLVTHGPLQAVVMAEAARAQGIGSVRQAFDYRLVSPLFDHQGLIAKATPDGARVETSVRDRFGRHTAQGVLATG